MSLHRRASAWLPRCFPVVAALACASGAAGAQGVPAAPACPAATPRAAAAAEPARVAFGADTGTVDIMLLASATVREVRFNRQPEIRVRLCGGLDSVRVIERRNLPDPVVVGQTYRDVYVAVEILGRVNASCLAERLGVGPAVRDSSRTSGTACAGITGTEGAPAPRTPDQPRP